MMRIILVILISLITNLVEAQVTIGSSFPPKKGILLEVKENENATNNSKGGIGLPRIIIEDINILGSNFDLLNPSLYTGTMVYNVATDSIKNIFPGIHYWDGKKWVLLGKFAENENLTSGSGTSISTSGSELDLGGNLNKDAIIHSNNGNSLIFSTNSLDGKFLVKSELNNILALRQI